MQLSTSSAVSWSLLLLAVAAGVVLCKVTKAPAVDDEFGITEDNIPKTRACLCSTVLSLNLRREACGDIVNVLVENRCVRYTGKSKSCALYGGNELMFFIELFVDKEKVWASGSSMKHGSEAECAANDENDLPGPGPSPKPKPTKNPPKTSTPKTSKTTKKPTKATTPMTLKTTKNPPKTTTPKTRKTTKKPKPRTTKKTNKSGLKTTTYKPPSVCNGGDDDNDGGVTTKRNAAKTTDATTTTNDDEGCDGERR